jgi:Na+/proline symporter
MLAAKDEKHAVGATLFFNFAHYALRPWPWIIVALSSIILFPDLESIKQSFPEIETQYLADDIAYPIMLTYLSPGWLGLVAASLIAAFMSTISTHLNWGSSYLVNDFYVRFVDTKATEKEKVSMGRVSTVVLMIISGFLALTVMENASQVFNILLLSGAGTGAVFLLRWFWWRISAITELAAMITAMFLAIILVLVIPDGAFNNQVIEPFTIKLLLVTGVTTLVWLLTVIKVHSREKTQFEKFDTLTESGAVNFKQSIMRILSGTMGVYAALFSIGSLLYGNMPLGAFLFIIFLVSIALIIRTFR